jgi:hypothetical protein
MIKKLAVVLAVASLFAAGVALPQDSKAPAATPNTSSSKSPGSDSPAQTGRMDEQMKKMQAMHDRIMNAKTPEERQKLMEENRRVMQDGMGMMSQMMQGESMMGGGAGGSMMSGAGAPMMGQKGSADSAAQMLMMQKRMDMMQMMMQSMLDQQGMMSGPGAPKK